MITKKYIYYILFLPLFLNSCTYNLKKQINNSTFISTNKSPKILGRDSYVFRKATFLYENSKQLIGGNAEASIKGYKGNYRLEGELVILEVKEVLCCGKMVAAFKVHQENGGTGILGLRYVDCEYQYYGVGELENIGLTYQTYCQNTLKIKVLDKKISLTGGKNSYTKER